jgi:uncharacterized oxidoreductase
MQLSDNTVLVTGGATGIGRAIAERFAKAGSEVIICGRREDRLNEARAVAGAHVRVCDVGRPEERIALAGWVTTRFPALNVVVNNAGIQRRVEIAHPEPWDTTREEIAINLEAPIHLARLFLPHLARQARPAIVNVTSGLAFAPKADVPVYCATKAALHSFTLSLRHQLAKTPIQVVEIIPPAVNTDLQAPGLHTFGVDVDEFADAVMERLAAGDLEVPYKFSVQSSRASRAELDQIFARMNG